MQGIVQKWLEGIGLSSAVITNFASAGIIEPEDLLELEAYQYESLGIDSLDNRRKLFFFIQKLKQAKLEADEDGGSDDDESDTSESGRVDSEEESSKKEDSAIDVPVHRSKLPVMVQKLKQAKIEAS